MRQVFNLAVRYFLFGHGIYQTALGWSQEECGWVNQWQEDEDPRRCREILGTTSRCEMRDLQVSSIFRSGCQAYMHPVGCYAPAGILS